jgi:hypothetical protein
MKKSQLQELIRNITRSIVREYISMQDKKALSANQSSISTSSDTPPEDAMSPGLKARMEREKEIARRNDVKTKEVELKTTKSKIDMQRKESDQLKRFTKPSLEKDIQRLKGAKI